MSVKRESTVVNIYTNQSGLGLSILKHVFSSCWRRGQIGECFSIHGQTISRSWIRTWWSLFDRNIQQSYLYPPNKATSSVTSQPAVYMPQDWQMEILIDDVQQTQSEQPVYNSSYTATNGGLGRDSDERAVRDERAAVGGLIKRNWGAKRGWCWHLCAYTFPHIYSSSETKTAVWHENYKMGYKSLQLWRESCFRLKVHSQTWLRIAFLFVLDCLEILTLSNMLTSLKWIVKVFSNL